MKKKSFQRFQVFPDGLSAKFFIYIVAAIFFVSTGIPDLQPAGTLTALLLASSILYPAVAARHDKAAKKLAYSGAAEERQWHRGEMAQKGATAIPGRYGHDYTEIESKATWVNTPYQFTYQHTNPSISTPMTPGITKAYSTSDHEKHINMNGHIQKAGENQSRLKVITGTLGRQTDEAMICYLNGVPLRPLKKEPLEALSSRIVKRTVDIFISSIVILLILSWMVPIIGLLIWLESRGPIFFMQPRSGKDNKPFLCMKFRSMKVNSKSNELQATRNDSRITRTGKFLRRTSLDEFPQFINVFKGEMSIVGPRPHMLKHTDEYSDLIDNFMVRQLVKPGITGWAQVNGLRGETSHLDQMRDRVNHDIWYMENWNHFLDFKIIFLTVYNTLKGEEMAY